jgi:hypothetical protein
MTEAQDMCDCRGLIDAGRAVRRLNYAPERGRAVPTSRRFVTAAGLCA